MPKATQFDALLQRQRKALGRHLKPAKIFRRAMQRKTAGRLYSEIVRRISPPDRYRDDVFVDGKWRFSESYDGTRAWYRDKNHHDPTEATGRALAFHRWSGNRLDHLRPLAQLAQSGCTLKDGGVQSTVKRLRLPTIQISMLDDFAETVFIDGNGRIAAHHLDLAVAEDEDRELEVCVDEWSQSDGLVHPVRSTVLDRNSGETFAEIIVTDASMEPYSPQVFDLSDS